MIEKANAVLKYMWPVTLDIVGAVASSLIGGLLATWLEKWIDRYYNLNTTQTI